VSWSPSFVSCVPNAGRGLATLPSSSAIGSKISSLRSSDLPRSQSSDFASPLSLLLELRLWLRSIATKDLGSLTLVELLAFVHV
jgi:hypothetical protein